MESAPPVRPWLHALQHRDPQFVDSYLAMRERILKDGAIPAKYKLLMAMVTDSIVAHSAGVTDLPTPLALQARRTPRSLRRSRSDTCTAAPRPL